MYHLEPFEPLKSLDNYAYPRTFTTVDSYSTIMEILFRMKRCEDSQASLLALSTGL